MGTGMRNSNHTTSQVPLTLVNSNSSLREQRFFSSVFIITRIVLQKDGKKIGKPASVFTAHLLGMLWTLSAIDMHYRRVSGCRRMGGSKDGLFLGQSGSPSVDYRDRNTVSIVEKPVGRQGQRTT